MTEQVLREEDRDKDEVRAETGETAPGQALSATASARIAEQQPPISGEYRAMSINVRSADSRCEENKGPAPAGCRK